MQLCAGSRMQSGRIDSIALQPQCDTQCQRVQKPAVLLGLLCRAKPTKTACGAKLGELGRMYTRNQAEDPGAVDNQGQARNQAGPCVVGAATTRSFWAGPGAVPRFVQYKTGQGQWQWLWHSPVQILQMAEACCWGRLNRRKARLPSMLAC